MDAFTAAFPVLAADNGHAAELVTEGFSAWASWIILFAPLAVALLVGAVPAIRKHSNVAAALSIGSVLLGLALTLIVYFIPSFAHPTTWEYVVPWVVIDGETIISFGARMDALALAMTLVVTGVGSAIFIYALGYMKGDESMGRFYGKFALFVFSMLGIVISPNFFQTFIFWELVGASSYLLIGYYWKKDSAGEAAKKAFMTNRVGDFGFLLGILMIWTAVGAHLDVYDPGKFGAFDFTVIQAAMTDLRPAALYGSMALAALAAALVFCGAMGKSAQFPLHVWLPDAMEGPTPVSALMHAATMVAAGIYMIVRCNFVIIGMEWAPTLIAWLGGITALIAASMAITQNDIKKVLAYSTLSQLGYMTMALGAGAYTAAMFHLTTHAFFKALLFLCAGSVIYGCHHEQDMFKMGGLRKVMPNTHKTFVIGSLALAGIFPLAGFWSKDEVLGAFVGNGRIAGGWVLLIIGVLVAGMTAFYMTRAYFLTFRGTYRGHAKPHESPKVMTMPLWFLAIFSVGIGFVGMPFAGMNIFGDFLHAFHHGGAVEFHAPLALVALAVAFVGMFVGYRVYGSSPSEDPLPARLGGLWTLWNRLYYIDDLYLWLVRVVQQGIAKVAWFFERWILIQGVVNGISQSVRVTGDRVRRVQSGYLGAYVTSFLLGAVLIALLVLLQVGLTGGGN